MTQSPLLKTNVYLYWNIQQSSEWARAIDSAPKRTADDSPHGSSREKMSQFHSLSGAIFR
jgi:hypothetical protein